MPTEGLSEEKLALKDDLPFRVNSDGWGDVWIETASGRRIGDLDRRIDADELNEAFALAARAEGPAPPGGGGEEALAAACADGEFAGLIDALRKEAGPHGVTALTDVAADAIEGLILALDRMSRSRAAFTKGADRG